MSGRMMLRLHYHPTDASMLPHIVLEELGVPFELLLVDKAAGAQRSPAYLKLNPNGKIPVLEDGALVLYETAAIALHLADGHADRHPQAALVPPLGTPARAQLYKWLMWCTNTLQAEMLLYFYPQRWADTPDAQAALKAKAEARIAGMVDQLDAELARHGGPWLLGDAYSIVDPFVLMLCHWTRHMARPARSLPHLGPYLRRLLARPAVRRAYVTEGIELPAA